MTKPGQAPSRIDQRSIKLHIDVLPYQRGYGIEQRLLKFSNLLRQAALGEHGVAEGLEDVRGARRQATIPAIPHN
jgi:hypothetical protein